MSVPDFGQLFIESKGQTIVVDGRSMKMLDRFTAAFNQ